MNENNNEYSAVGLEEMSPIASTDLCEAFGRTGIGGRGENQDTYGGTHKDAAVILTVCDGMGGMNGGQTASHIAVDEIVRTLAETPEKDLGVDAIRKAVEAANAAIYRCALETPPLRGMGTTATVLVMAKDAAYLTHVGDSRIYQLRKGAKVFRTFDHSKVFEMVSRGMMTEEQARQSSFSNIITRALGIRPKVEMTVERIPYKAGDRFVLCSDGVWNCEPEPEVIKMFNADKRPDETLRMLTERVNAIGRGRGGDHDNLTAIIVDVKKDSEYQYSCWRILKDALAKRCRSMKRRKRGK